MNDIIKNYQELLAVKNRIAGEKKKVIKREHLQMINEQLKLIEELCCSDPKQLKQRWDSLIEEYKEMYGGKEEETVQKPSSSMRQKK